MSRSLTMLLVFPLFLCASGPSPRRRNPRQRSVPDAKDSSITVNAFMKDDKQNELLLGTRLWPDHPTYNAVALQRYFALMKALGPAYKQDDNVAYVVDQGPRRQECAIYLEAFEAGVRTGTGALVGCGANGVQQHRRCRRPPIRSRARSPSQDPASQRRAGDVQEAVGAGQGPACRSNSPRAHACPAALTASAIRIVLQALRKFDAVACAGSAIAARKSRYSSIMPGTEQAPVRGRRRQR
jgi:hypothetical protein